MSSSLSSFSGWHSIIISSFQVQVPHHFRKSVRFFRTTLKPRKRDYRKLKSRTFPVEQLAPSVLIVLQMNRPLSWICAWGLFLKRPSNLKHPESDFDIKVSRKVGRVLTSDEAHFVSLTDKFTVSTIFKPFEAPSRMENKTA